MDIKTLKIAESILLNRRHNAMQQNDKNRGILMNSSDFRSLNDAYNVALPTTIRSNDPLKLAELAKLDKAMNDYAIAADLPTNNFNCKECEDSGTTATGNRCDCLVKIYRELIVDSFDCGKPLQSAALNTQNIPPASQHSTLTKLFERCDSFIKSFPTTNYNQLIFSGNSGVGKTYIVSAIADALIDKGFDVAYCDAYTLNQKFLEHHLGKLDNSKAFMQKLYNADLLIIDDLGSEKLYNKVTSEYLKNILDMRNKRHTLITTNFDIDSTEFKTRYGERIHSRLNDIKLSFCFTIKGDDLRLKNR